MSQYEPYSGKEKFWVTIEYLMAIILPLMMIAGYAFYQNYNKDFTSMIDVKYDTKLVEIGNFTKEETLEEPFYIINNNLDVPVYIRYSFKMDQVDTTSLISINDNNVIEEDGYFYVKATNKSKITLFDELTWLQDYDIKEKTSLYINIETIEAKESAVTKAWINNSQLSLNNAKKLGYRQ